jgi:ABC-2 type transport system ATP-binding protein
MEADAIRTRGLIKRFGDNCAVDGLELSVPAGVFYGLLGPNGAGKSTTINMLTGTSRPSEGSIDVFGQPLDDTDPIFKSQMGVVTEEPALFERLIGREQLVFVGRMYGLERSEAARRADRLLSLLLLDKHPRTLIADYSRGMRKKLAIACALIHGPRLVFFDEPFDGADATSSETIRQVLASLTGGGATVLLTTHILEVAQKICQRVGIIVQGKLAFEADMDVLRAEGRELGTVFREVVGAEGEVEIPDWLAPGGAG